MAQRDGLKTVDNPHHSVSFDESHRLLFHLAGLAVDGWVQTLVRNRHIADSLCAYPYGIPQPTARHIRGIVGTVAAEVLG